MEKKHKVLGMIRDVQSGKITRIDATEKILDLQEKVYDTALLNELSKEIHNKNKEKGFDVSKENIGQSLMLIVSELAEALEADRKNKYADTHRFDIWRNNVESIDNEDFIEEFESSIKDTFEDEIADSMIRLFDLCGGLNIDIERHIGMKRHYNSTRPFKHNKKY